LRTELRLSESTKGMPESSERMASDSMSTAELSNSGVKTMVVSQPPSQKRKRNFRSEVEGKARAGRGRMTVEPSAGTRSPEGARLKN
jgi:hypothetical protein